jgi:protein-tyrosine phosphatase
MGEGILKFLVGSRPDFNQWRIESAGVWAEPGCEATKNAQIEMDRRGIDISLHRSRPLNEKLIQQFNLILTMEKDHKDRIIAAFPAYADRVFMINELVGRADDIADPIGGDLKDYRQTADRLERILSTALDRIYQLASASDKKNLKAESIA